MNHSEEFQRVSKARTELLMTQRWYGMLAMKLDMIEKPAAACPTMQTNGTVLEFSAEFVQACTDQEILATVAHEVEHCALGHMFRAHGRDWQRWNEAADYSINPRLVQTGFSLPKGFLIDEARFPAGMSAEQIYAIRAADEREAEESGKPGKEDNAGQPQPGGMTPPPAPQDGQAPGAGTPTPGQGQSTPGKSQDSKNGTPAPAKVMTEADWQIAAEQAEMITKKGGTMPGGVEEAIAMGRQTGTDWVAITRRFVENTVASDTSWMKPNRNYLSQGIYLPGVVKENVPALVVVLDSSYSTKPFLGIFGAELTTLLHEVRPAAIHVICCDTRFQSIQTFTPDDEEIELVISGHGGTKFQPAFEYINELDEQPAAVIYLTDLQNSDPQDVVEPSYPVLWIVPEQFENESGSFGETVHISEWAA